MESKIINEINSLFTSRFTGDQPGFALAIYKDGEVIFRNGFGLANLEYNIPIQSGTVFHAASVSKQFTALAVHLLVRDNRMALDDDIRNYLPELPEFNHSITVKHLLHHTSGLRDQWELLVFTGWRMEDVITTQDIFELVCRQRELNFLPGDRFHYSNTGYTLLALAVERISGKPFPEFCRERIFHPLGMQQSLFYDDAKKVVPNRAYSYIQFSDGNFQKGNLAYSTVGPSSLLTTVDDLMCWEEDFHQNAKVINAEIFKSMVEPGYFNNHEPFPYASGLILGSYQGLPTIEHSGADAGYRASLLRFPKNNCSIAILGNSRDIIPEGITRRVANLVLKNKFTIPLAEPSEAVDEKKDIAGPYYCSDTDNWREVGIFNDRLAINNGYWEPLIEISPGTYTTMEAPFMTIAFSAKGESNRQMFWRTTGGLDVVEENFERIPSFELSTTSMQAYIGWYYSPELDTKVKIEIVNGKLMLKRFKHGWSPLVAVLKDKFVNPFEFHTGSEYRVRLDFYRNQNDQIDGFLMSTGRLHQLRFIRCEDNGTLCQKL